MSYHPSKLIPLKAKGGVWYVQVTKPKELQSTNNKQVRRSTGTIDHREAMKRQHRIAEEIYAEFDAKLEQLNPQPPVKIVYLDGPADPLAAFRPQPSIPLDDISLRLSRVVPKYLDSRNWNRDKTRNGVASHLKEFTSVIGDLQIDRLKKKHAYQYARYLDQTGFAKNTIGTRVRDVGTMLTWCEEHDLVDDHKLRNLRLSDYGYPGRPWKPFPRDELNRIFLQELPDQERLCLSLLAVTGARLDEIALLRWSQVKTRDDIQYLDLTEAIIKTQGSKRLVPLHKRLALPNQLGSRLFSYPEGQDGKSQNNASRAMMPLCNRRSNTRPR